VDTKLTRQSTFLNCNKIKKQNPDRTNGRDLPMVRLGVVWWLVGHDGSDYFLGSHLADAKAFEGDGHVLSEVCSR